MKKVLFIVGSALGHVGRSMRIAQALLSKYEMSICFTGADSISFMKRWPIDGVSLLELPSNMVEDYGLSFAKSLEAVFHKIKPDLICCDITPLPWLSLVRFPKIPQVYITNYFVTHIGEFPTVQDQMFEKTGSIWNWLRKKRGLSPLRTARDLYEKDVVILLDPQDIIPDRERMPSNFKIAGPCTWEPPVDIPSELRERQNLMYISLGSTRNNTLPDELIRTISSIVGLSDIVESKASLRHSRASSITKLSYDWLPGRKVLKRSIFAMTHGGTGSAYQALELGVPVGCWPNHQNHKILGLRLEKMNLGVVFTANNWKKKIGQFEMKWPKMVKRAREISNSLRLVDGPTNAARAIAKLMEMR